MHRSRWFTFACERGTFMSPVSLFSNISRAVLSPASVLILSHPITTSPHTLSNQPLGIYSANHFSLRASDVVWSPFPFLLCLALYNLHREAFIIIMHASRCSQPPWF